MPFKSVLLYFTKGGHVGTVTLPLVCPDGITGRGSWFTPWNTCPVKPLYVSYGMLGIKIYDFITILLQTINQLPPSRNTDG
ncbi:MAG: hypothetical protein PHH10_08815, partial [Dysgonamonadaceae bacterium]|nr:hypothetical protein [Dysgonamonadaceae bacterium]